MAAQHDRLLVLCRPGFEDDCAAELEARSAEAGSWGYARTRAEAGLLEFVPGDDPFTLLTRPPFATPVFPRQWCAATPLREGLPATDRLEPLLADLTTPVGDVLVEVPEGDAYRGLSRLAQRLVGPLKGRLQQAGLWRPEVTGAPRLHLVLASGTSAWRGLSPADRSSPRAGGVLRLRSDRRAPSRSALKLEEALTTLLDPVDRHLLFDARVRAVDLGAAPGGWTWVLRRHGAAVTAVDNGALAAALVGDPGVEHVRGDAFTFRPREAVDWVVCDVVDKPARVVEMMARWLRRGWARRALFNLKLPMQRRWRAVEDAGARFRRVLRPAADGYVLRIRQLYHDREEVTCLALPATNSQ